MSRRRGRAFGLLCLVLAGAACSAPVRRDAAAEERLTRASLAEEARLRTARERRDAADLAAARVADDEELKNHH